MNNTTDLKSFMDMEKRNTRIILIQRIFEYEQFVGLLYKKAVKNRFYYNDRFDELYDMNFYHLEELEQQFSGLADEYKQLILK